MKTLSSILLILNPICGFLMVGSIVIGGYWWLSIFPLAFIVYLIMIFYFKTHKEEFEEWKKDYDYIGQDYYSYFYKHKVTGEIVER